MRRWIRYFFGNFNILYVQKLLKLVFCSPNLPDQFASSEKRRFLFPPCLEPLFSFSLYLGPKNILALILIVTDSSAPELTVSLTHHPMPHFPLCAVSGCGQTLSVRHYSVNYSVFPWSCAAQEVRFPCT